MDFEVILVVAMLFIGLPWVILHYMTKWKTAATITVDDEVLLEELYNLAKRLDERMDTVERLVASDDPGFTPARRLIADQEQDNQQLRELEALIAEIHDAGQERLPGDRRYANRREAAAKGIPLSDEESAMVRRYAGL